MSDPWAFGWIQLLTIIGFIITIGIAFGGFRTFGRWKREKIEEKKIEIAFEALALAYEATYVIDSLRAPIENSAEWVEMPKVEGETDADRKTRAPSYVIWKRMDYHKEFFQRLSRLQPRFMATFGAEKEEIFGMVHFSVRDIQMAAWIKSFDGSKDEDIEHQKVYEEVRDMLSSVLLSSDDDDDEEETKKEPDRVSKRLVEFRREIEALCKPIVDREYRRD